MIVFTDRTKIKRSLILIPIDSYVRELSLHRAVEGCPDTICKFSIVVPFELTENDQFAVGVVFSVG